MAGASGTNDPEARDLYDRSIKCWVDLMVASNLGPALGIQTPEHTRDATEAWQKGAMEIGAILGKDKSDVKSDAKTYSDPIFAAIKAPEADLPELIKPILERAAHCEAQFTGRHS